MTPKHGQSQKIYYVFKSIIIIVIFNLNELLELLDDWKGERVQKSILKEMA